MISTDISGFIVQINKQAELLTRWSQEEALGSRSRMFSALLEAIQEIIENPCLLVLQAANRWSGTKVYFLLPKMAQNIRSDIRAHRNGW